MPELPDASVFIATSIDGYIARPDGALDWLPQAADGPAEDYGYAAFMAGIDAIVMGRATFEKVLSFDAWPYAGTPVFVATGRPLSLPPRFDGEAIERVSGEPPAIAATLADRGFRHLYIDGGKTIRAFLNAGLVGRMVITRIPVLLGNGLPLFEATGSETRLNLLRTRSWASGLEQSEYRVERCPSPSSPR
jgi:dihydrofolate reductase